MFNKSLVVLFALFFVFGSSYVFASEIKETARTHESTPSLRHGGEWIDRVLCIDGLKVFQTAAFGRGSDSGAAVSNIQLYEEKNGKVVPVRCSSKYPAKKSTGETPSTLIARVLYHSNQRRT